MNAHSTFITVMSKPRALTRWAHIHVLVTLVGLVMDLVVKVIKKHLQVRIDLLNNALFLKQLFLF